MTDYIISEKLLDELVKNYEDSTYWASKELQKYLKSKSPIDQHGIDSYLYHEAKKHDMYTNENINVYVEVIK